MSEVEADLHRPPAVGTKRRFGKFASQLSANNGSDHFGVLGLRVAAASCHSGKQEQTSKRSVRQHVAILPVTGAIGPV
jgi:hypothetical protein